MASTLDNYNYVCRHGYTLSEDCPVCDSLIFGEPVNSYGEDINAKLAAIDRELKAAGKLDPIPASFTL